MKDGTDLQIKGTMDTREQVVAQRNSIMEEFGVQITRGYDSSGTSRRTETTEVRAVGTRWFVFPFPANRATHLNRKNSSRFQPDVFTPPRITSPSSGAPPEAKWTFSPARYLQVTRAL